MSEQAPIISADNVERTFRQGRREVRALRGVTLRATPGSLVVLMGPSGSGKTTLLNLLGGLDTPSAGAVTVAGQRLDQLSAGALAAQRRRIGFIFQSFALLPTATAYENIELGLRISGGTPRAEWDGRIRGVLAAVGLTEWAQHRPYELSGGQQQRVAVARALAIRPRLILADEPTGDLDSVMSQRILTLLRELVDREGLTLIMTTHDPAALSFATEHYRLRDGMIEPMG